MSEELTPITRIEEYLDGIVNGGAIPLEPVTRVEQFLDSIANSQTCALTPVTRIEQYLGKISGQDIELPEPVTRVEMYLAAIAGEDVIVPDAPVTRIEMYLDAWANGGSPEYDTVSGAIASFVTLRAAPLKELVVDVEPVQDLHGYDNPWPAGGGKNLLDIKPYTGLNYNISAGASVALTDGETVIVSGNTISYAVAAWGYRDFRTPVLAEGTYHINIDVSEITNPRITAYVIGTDDKIRVSENGASLTTISINLTVQNGEYIALFIGSNTAQTLTVKNVQVESGSSYTSWTPYSNICPISGWTEANVTRTGKNLSSVAVNPGNPYTYWGGDFAALRSVLNSLPVGTYTISNKYSVVTAPDSNAVQYGRPFITAMVNGSQINVLGFSVTSDPDAYVGKVYEESGTFTITEAIKGNINHCYVYCDRENNHTGTGRGTYNCYDVQIEYGSTASDYEAYQGNTYSISWQSTAGTVYGGTLTVLEDGSAEVKETWAEADMGDLSFSFGMNNIFSANIGIKAPTDYDERKTGFLSSVYPVSNVISINQNMDDNALLRYDNSIFFRCTSANDTTELHSFVDGVQLVYELATPITYQLTTQQVISALQGYNAMWADTGDVTVTFRGTPVVEPDEQPLQALNLLLGGAYRNNQTQDDVSDEEALDILLGGADR